jgi:hypothetical protein
MQPIKTRDGVLLTNEYDQMKRWQEHFKEILNPRVIEIITSSPLASSTDRRDKEEEKEQKEKVMERPPNKDVIKKALKNTKNCKALCLDSIPPELLTADLTANIHCSLFENIWKQETIPEEWRKGLLFKLPKKGKFLTVQIGEELHYFM